MECFMFKGGSKSQMELKKPYSKHNSNSRDAPDRCCAALYEVVMFISGFWRMGLISSMLQPAIISKSFSSLSGVSF